MNYRKLGNTGLMISEIGMGCEGFSEQNYTMAKTLLDAAEKNGVNYFDLYASDPRVREAVGTAMLGRRENLLYNRISALSGRTDNISGAETEKKSKKDSKI